MNPANEILEVIQVPEPRALVGNAVRTLITITHNGIMYAIDSVIQQIIDMVMGITDVVKVNLGAVTTSISKGLAMSIVAQLNGVVNNLKHLVDVFVSLLSSQISGIQAFIAGINIPEPFRTALNTNIAILKRVLVTYITPLISTLNVAVAGIKVPLIASSGSTPGPAPIPIPIPPGFSGALVSALHPVLKELVDNTLNVFGDYASQQIDKLLTPIFDSLIKLTN